MADFQINPAGPDTGQIQFKFGDFTKEDGSAGDVQDDSISFVLAPAIGDVSAPVMAEDGSSFTCNVSHNGGVGEATLTAKVDGDVGLGVSEIVRSKTIEFMAPLGATAGELTAGTEGPIG